MSFYSSSTGEPLVKSATSPIVKENEDAGKTEEAATDSDAQMTAYQKERRRRKLEKSKKKARTGGLVLEEDMALALKLWREWSVELDSELGQFVNHLSDRFWPSPIIHQHSCAVV